MNTFFFAPPPLAAVCLAPSLKQHDNPGDIFTRYLDFLLIINILHIRKPYCKFCAAPSGGGLPNSTPIY